MLALPQVRTISIFHKLSWIKCIYSNFFYKLENNGQRPQQNKLYRQSNNNNSSNHNNNNHNKQNNYNPQQKHQNKFPPNGHHQSINGRKEHDGTYDWQAYSISHSHNHNPPQGTIPNNVFVTSENKSNWRNVTIFRSSSE